MGVRITVDATSDMTPQVAAKEKPVPMTVIFWKTDYAVAVAFFAQK